MHADLTMQRARALLPIVGVIAASLALASCASTARVAFTETEQNIAGIPGMSNVRFFADAPLAEVSRLADTKALLTAGHKNGRFDLLAISGGAWDGAYGAGIVTGLTKSGNRPQFTIVTGVSAGALIAPFAFAGPDFDDELKDAFTSGQSASIGDGSNNLFSIIADSDTRRETLHALISRYVDDRFLHAIAIEHRRGRRLMIVTTNLDAQRAVVWNMGAIASSGHPRALELFRDVLTASSSVPGMFEPTHITVTANGREFQELHADGGVTTNVFILPDSMLTSGANDPERGKLPGSVYVIMNGRLAPEFEMVQAQFVPALGRSLATVLKSHAKNTVLANVAFARSAGLDFNLTQIDMELPQDLKPSFDTAYMRAVYAIGYNRAVAGNFWEKTLPLSRHR
jgi:hypothetical protein